MAKPIVNINCGSVPCKQKVIPNLLPCRVHHTGPVRSVSAYWHPAHDEASTSVAYFRGRKLEGKSVKLPEHYQGFVIEQKVLDRVTNDEPIKDQQSDAISSNESPPLLQATARFDLLTVWSHEVVTDAASSPYIRAVDEWLQISDQIHTFPEKNRASS